MLDEQDEDFKKRLSDPGIFTVEGEVVFGEKSDKEPERVRAPATDAVRRIASKFRLPKKRLTPKHK